MKIEFTNHAREKLQRRKFIESEIIESIKKPDKILKRHGKYYYQKKLDRGSVEIVCEKTEKIIKVITVYWL